MEAIHAIAPVLDSRRAAGGTLMGDTLEHPSFTRAKALSPHLRRLFATSRDEATRWRPTRQRHALASRVLVVAQTRIECAWAAYCDAVPGVNHDHEEMAVLESGSKLEEELARLLFPFFAEVPYAR